jgi:two-component system, cell cycle sensor histidine kinase and response regulator CckA
MLIYAGKGALAFESVDLSRVVEDMSSLIHSIVPRKIQLVQKLARDLPTLRGDKVQVGQVAMNLVANAVDAIQDNTGVIEVSSGIAEVDEDLIRSCFFAENREPDAYLYLRVKDTGVGMSDHQVERIFDPFYTEKRTSRGLGLSSLSGIVRQHKGFIRVVSEPDSGSEFTIYFPVVVIQESSGDSRFAARSSDRKGKVLLADDDPRIRTLMASILESDHFRLTSAEDGKEALRIYEQEPDQFDLLVLDCTMPKMSGTELYRKIRGNGSMVPIVLVSGYHQEQVAASINHDPNAYFIKKPFNVDDFLAMVHDALKDRQRHPV